MEVAEADVVQEQDLGAYKNHTCTVFFANDDKS